MQGNQTASRPTSRFARTYQEIYTQENFFKNGTTTGPTGPTKDGGNKNTTQFNGLTETYKHRNKRQKTAGPKVAEMDHFNYENFRALNISDSDDESNNSE